ncbi:hypothetical protein I0C86_15660 [Plantactinospora sp. S1510]|uniref:Lipoprotein n=1 Tax=Plantactinospora alkalitolerans TaxID=2789879 RepID=A0ABS0GVZ4_9ACTN|nr:hypothetical protein [Plantactinospora alkalitolerans]MBF9130383.1 hypothetical protein [Plantactinospora alkalitolerans]
MKISRLAKASMVAVAALSLLGCSAADNETPKTDQEQEDAQFLKYVKCLQDNGVEASYSQGSDGRGHFDVDSGPGDPKFKAARQACAEYVPQEMKKTASPSELDALIKVAACMRKQGIAVEDPTIDDPALHIGGAEGDSRKIEEIRASCQKETLIPSPSS